MSNDRVIQATFATYKPVPSRGVLTLQLEVDENAAQHALEVLGYPIQGQQIMVAVARLNDKYNSIQEGKVQIVEDNTATEYPLELRNRITHAAMLCKEVLFQKFAEERGYPSHNDGSSEEFAKFFIYDKCHIQSLKELALNEIAYGRFQAMKQDFEGWKIT